MSEFKFDDKGLIPVVVQDHITGEVLMVAWANEEAIQKMKETGYTHFWSRSRQKLWKKGEESGNVQKIVSIQSDCDDDTLLVRVIQKNGIACHTGNPTCFYKTVYGDPMQTSMIIAELRRVIHDRKVNPEEGSYTCKLFNDETKMCKKIVEEAAEYVLAIKDKDEDEVAWELADLIYHSLVAAEKENIDLQKVYEKLAERR
jgi:phosphoribosyl-ATP pyrophosphohydrolase